MNYVGNAPTFEELIQELADSFGCTAIDYSNVDISNLLYDLDNIFYIDAEVDTLSTIKAIHSAKKFKI